MADFAASVVDQATAPNDPYPRRPDRLRGRPGPKSDHQPPPSG